MYVSTGFDTHPMTTTNTGSATATTHPAIIATKGVWGFEYNYKPTQQTQPAKCYKF
jgi:hypothetical protein